MQYLLPQGSRPCVERDKEKLKMRKPGAGRTCRIGTFGALVVCMVGSVIFLPTVAAVAATQSGPSVTIRPESGLNFDAQVINTESAPRKIELISDGDQPATIGGVQILDIGRERAAGDFHVATNSCSGKSFPANASCLIEVSFKPTGGGPRSARLVFAGGNIGDRVGLDGVGVDALVVTPTVAELPDQPVGTTGTPFDVTVRNNQTVAAAAPVLTESQYVNPAPGQFVIAKNGCDNELAPLTTCKIAISFAPRKGSGQYLAVYNLDFSGNYQLKLGVTGKATDPPSKKPNS
jgi:hypothetical protein